MVPDLLLEKGYLSRFALNRIIEKTVQHLSPIFQCLCLLGHAVSE